MVVFPLAQKTIQIIKMNTDHIKRIPELTDSWIKVGRKYYNLDNAVTFEVSMDDVIVTFPGHEIANTRWDKKTDKIVEDRIPIQLSFNGIYAAIICEWVEERATELKGKRTVLVSGQISEQNRT